LYGISDSVDRKRGDSRSLNTRSAARLAELEKIEEGDEDDDCGGTTIGLQK
jgi:hypothetical protein